MNLYPEERRQGIMEDVVQQMRNDISYGVLKGDVFRVGYTGSNPRTVQKVAETLAGFFVDESLSDQSNLAEGTSQFLEAQVEDARRRLIDKEKKLQEYRTQVLGPAADAARVEPPGAGQPAGADPASSPTRSIRRRTGACCSKARRRTSKVRRPAARARRSVPTMSAAGDAVQGGTLMQQLEFAKAQLDLLQKHYTDAQPDVRRLKGIVADLQAKVDAEALTRPVSAEPTPAVSSVELARQKKLKDTRDQIAQLDKQIDGGAGAK